MRVHSRLIGRRSSNGIASNIPLSWDDARFASNTAGPSVNSSSPITTVPQTFTQNDWDAGPLLASGDGNTPIANWAEGTGSVSFDRCRIRWREGLRQGTEATVTTYLDGCYFHGYGLESRPPNDDHADMVQADGTAGDIVVTNTCLHSLHDDEAIALTSNPYACGSDAFRWADNSSGLVSFTNVLIRGGGRGITIAADTGQTTISWENVYIVPEGSGFPTNTFYAIRMSRWTGTRVIQKWVNVRFATIVDGVIVPGDQIPEPAAISEFETQLIYGDSNVWR